MNAPPPRTSSLAAGQPQDGGGGGGRGGGSSSHAAANARAAKEAAHRRREASGEVRVVTVWIICSNDFCFVASSSVYVITICFNLCPVLNKQSEKYFNLTKNQTFFKKSLQFPHSHGSYGSVRLTYMFAGAL